MNASHTQRTEQRAQAVLADLPQKLRLVMQHLQTRQAGSAEIILLPILKYLPQHEQAIRLWGLTMSAQRRYTEALAAFKQRQELLPDQAEAANDVANCSLQMGLNDDALVHARMATSLDPSMTAARFNLGRALKAAGDVESAVEELSAVLAEEPKHFAAHLIMADCLKALGRPGDAEFHYREVIRIKPALGAAWWSLANTKSLRLTDEDQSAIRRRLDVGAPPAEAVYLHFALAKALEDQKDYRAAFEQLAAGNAIRKNQTRWDGKGFSRWVNTIIESSDSLSIPDRQAELQSPRPIFIVSLPRSGSTLTEQILASHSAVTAADELPYIPQLMARESQRRKADFSSWSSKLSSREWLDLGDNYLSLVERFTKDTPVMVDKLPGNFVHIGALLNMFPDALVVVCRREALDVCVSNFRQLFVRGQEFSYDLKDLARYWKDFDRLAGYWEARCPERVLRFDYESLVEDTEAQSRRLIEFAGLAWEAACLKPHEGAHAIATASALQVREPIHSGNKGAWRRYENDIQSLLDALQAPESST